MAKKSKHHISAPRKERLRLMSRRWDLLCFLLALVVILAAWQCNGVAFSLSRPDMEGFAGWFLLIFAYVPLLALGGFCHLLGLPAFQCNEAILLGGCNLVIVVAIWIIFRLTAVRSNNADRLRIAGNFALMVLIWGIFQIAFAFTLKLWTSPSMEPLMRHFAQTEECVEESRTAADPGEITFPRS